MSRQHTIWDGMVSRLIFTTYGMGWCGIFVLFRCRVASRLVFISHQQRSHVVWCGYVIMLCRDVFVWSASRCGGESCYLVSFQIQYRGVVLSHPRLVSYATLQHTAFISHRYVRRDSTSHHVSRAVQCSMMSYRLCSHCTAMRIAVRYE